MAAALALLILMRPCTQSTTPSRLRIPHTAGATAAPPAVLLRRSYSAPVDDVLVGCGDICHTDMAGAPGKYFDTIKKHVDCDALMTNAAIDAAMLEAEPPKAIPDHLLDAFTYGGRVAVKNHLPDGTVLNNRHLGRTAATSWSHEMIEATKANCSAGTLAGTYGTVVTSAVRDMLDHASVSGSRVLVIGSQVPWLEGCLLAGGAREVVTIEYGSIKSTHPQIKTMTPAEAAARAKELMGSFDAVATFSSLEHSGLGRYGDAMNPWGDLQAVARAWCMTRHGGRLFVGIPEALGADGKASDIILYNAHRNYGPVQLPHLFANWDQVWSGKLENNIHRVWVVEKA